MFLRFHGFLYKVFLHDYSVSQSPPDISQNLTPGEVITVTQLLDKRYIILNIIMITITGSIYLIQNHAKQKTYKRVIY